MHIPNYPVSDELERYAERLLASCKKGLFGEVHMILMKSRSWMEYEEPTPEEAGFWLGILSAAPYVGSNREVNELLQRYRRELYEKIRARPPQGRQSATAP